ncbi:MAG TPA: nickel-dependent lactate racemase [Anaerolineaceae bacterium]|nr:nickel-dependent lactate racemase [Anaerolineaceae bacterium]
MAQNSLSIPWGKEQMQIRLPASWQVSGVLEPASLPPVADPLEEAARSLSAPVGSPRLSELYRLGMKVTLVVDDGSRPTPVFCLFPAVLAGLEGAGMPRADLTIVPALGLHRAMTEEEIAARLGLPDLAGFRWTNPACDDEASMANLGTTRRGTPVWVSRAVAEADLVVSIGCIEPHIIASFGGGYKNLVPGVAGRATIAHNHSLNCTPRTFNMVGQPIESNPMRLDLEEAAGMLKAPVFIVNAVLDSRQQVVCVVAGHPIQAHREGVKTSAALYGVKVPAPADVVITGSHPMDSDLRQGVKALANTIRAARPGGVVITLVKAEEGVGVFGLANRKLPLGRGALRRLAPALVRLVPRLKLKGMGEEDRFFLYFALQAMRHGTLLMVAPTIPAVVKENLPFVEFADTLEQALERAGQKFPGQAKVLVFPHGGITYPVLN